MRTVFERANTVWFVRPEKSLQTRDSPPCGQERSRESNSKKEIKRPSSHRRHYEFFQLNRHSRFWFLQQPKDQGGCTYALLRSTDVPDSTMLLLAMVEALLAGSLALLPLMFSTLASHSVRRFVNFVVPVSIISKQNRTMTMLDLWLCDGSD